METWLLLEYCDRSHLGAAIAKGKFRRRADGAPDMVAILRSLLEIASGMAYLHSLGVLHGDLKPENVLLKSSSQGGDARLFTCKLGDFGMSRLLETGATHMSTQTYGAPPQPPLPLGARLLTCKLDNSRMRPLLESTCPHRPMARRARRPSPQDACAPPRRALAAAPAPGRLLVCCSHGAPQCPRPDARATSTLTLTLTVNPRAGARQAPWHTSPRSCCATAGSARRPTCTRSRS